MIPPRKSARAGIWVSGVVLVLGAAGVWWLRSEPGPISAGEPVPIERAIPVSAALDPARWDDDPTGVAEGGNPDGSRRRLVIRGRVGEVCRSAGCWFVVQEVAGGRLYELLVDLKKHDGLHVDPDVSGRTAFVVGTLVGDPPDLKLEADGFQVE